VIGLWDTTGNEVVKALAAERRNAGGVTSGLVLTLIVVVDERRVREAEAAATIAAAAHPCRLLVVVRSDVERTVDRLDAEIVVGGRLGPCEAVVLRMYGRLALHAESVVMPLLAPDVPVVTWWHGEPPERIAYDFLGVVADRRITDTAQSADPMAALRVRAEDYAPGDTDLAWTRVTPWRALVASAFDIVESPVTAVEVRTPADDPRSALMAGWLGDRLGLAARVTEDPEHPDRHAARFEFADGSQLTLEQGDTHAVLRRTGHADRQLPLARRPLGDELAEELRRLDADQIYAAALSRFAGLSGLDERSSTRTHVWRDPALVGLDQPNAAAPGWGGTP
jgi:glucose-6-phosphate dehydrogenase assembly protein OpcA